METALSDAIEHWPSLPFQDWKPTCATLHMWTQIVGKIRLAQMPWINHSWHVPLYVTPRGLTTTAIPHGSRTFEIEFDFVDHALRIETAEAIRQLPLRPQAVAEFYAALVAALRDLALSVRIHTTPNEVEPAIPFEHDRVHASYDPEHVGRFSRVLGQTSRLLTDFRARFIGKVSPVHFFWGGFDLAVTRFSGRTAPLHPGGVPHLPDWVVREAYSHEVSSCGFWPGGDAAPFPLFYSYAYPEPDGFREAPVKPAAAFYSPELREFVLPYDDVRRSADPDATLLAFLESTYAAAADLSGWERAALERTPPPP